MSQPIASATRYAALLRGINVGGHRRIPMSDLRSVLEQLGHENVSTYLQSGQAVFTAGTDDEEILAAAIHDELSQRFGASIDVIVRSHAYLKSVVDDCPFPAAEIDGKQLHAAYASAPLDAGSFEEIDRAAFLPEEYHLGDRVLYLWLPGGIGRSKLAARLATPRLVGPGRFATVRNWNTARKLVELTQAT